VSVIVKNVGDATWPAVGDAEGRYAVVLRDRWLKSDGSVSEDGAAGISYDLEPGDTVGLSLQIQAPAAPGNYVLELDMAQDGAARFGSRSSRPLRAGVVVNAPTP
jgi:hypothetical protein